MQAVKVAAATSEGIPQSDSVSTTESASSTVVTQTLASGKPGLAKVDNPSQLTVLLSFAAILGIASITLTVFAALTESLPSHFSITWLTLTLLITAWCFSPTNIKALPFLGEHNREAANGSFLPLIMLLGITMLCIGAAWFCLTSALILERTVFTVYPAMLVSMSLFVEALYWTLTRDDSSASVKLPRFGWQLVNELAQVDENSSDQSAFPSGNQPSLLPEGLSFSLQRGDVAGTDAQILEGILTVAERRLSPTPNLRILEEGEIVLAGSTVLGGVAKLKSLVPSQDSCIARLERLCRQPVKLAQSVRVNELQENTNTVVLVVLFLACAAAISVNERTGSPILALISAGTVFFASSALRARRLILALSAQVTAWLYRAGDLVTGSDTLEKLAHCDQILAAPSAIQHLSDLAICELYLSDDRIGQPELSALLLNLLSRSESELFQLAASQCWKLSRTLEPVRVLNFKEVAGHGVSGSLKGIEFAIGTEDFMIESGVVLRPSDTEPLEDEIIEGNTTDLLVSLRKDVIARFQIKFVQPNNLIDSPSSGAVPFVIQSEVKNSGPDIRTLVVLDSVQTTDRPNGIGGTALAALYTRERLQLPSADIVSLDGSVRRLGQCISKAKLFTKTKTVILSCTAGSATTLVCSAFVGWQHQLALVSLALVATNLIFSIVTTLFVFSASRKLHLNPLQT